MNLAAACAFVEREGTPLERARLHALLSRRAAPAVPEELAAATHADGGWALDWEPDRPSSLHATVHALDALADLGLLETPAAQAGLDFMSMHQSRRGIWREAGELATWELPLWMDSTNPAADVYTTALCAGALAQYGGNELVVDRGVNWLQTQQGRAGLLPGWKLHSSWLALPAFVQVLDVQTRSTRRLVGGLGEALGADWTGDMLTGCLSACLSAGYTLHTTLVARAWDLLRAQQGSDGGWSVAEDERPAVALQAVAVALQIELGHGR